LAVSWRLFSTCNIIAAVLNQRPAVDDHGNGSIVKIPTAGDKYHIFFRELYCFDSIEQFHS